MQTNEARLESRGSYELRVEGDSLELILTLADPHDGVLARIHIPECVLGQWACSSADIRDVRVVSWGAERWRLASYFDRLSWSLILLLSSPPRPDCRLVIPMAQMDAWLAMIQRAKRGAAASVRDGDDVAG